MSGKSSYNFNTAIETVFKSIKAELIWRRTWETRRQTETAIFQYINRFYKPRRRHSALGGKSPLIFECQQRLDMPPNPPTLTFFHNP